MEIRWTESFSASALHAAEAAVLGRPFSQPSLQQAIAEPAAALHEELLRHELPERDIWRHIVALAATVGSNEDLADITLRKTVGGDRSREDVVRLAGCVSDIEAAVLRVIPDVDAQLAARVGPLREQWEARGPGWLRSVARLTEPSLIPERAEVVLLLPAIGGAGRAHLLYNLVRIEAVLANADSRLPEGLRLGWLLSQLNSDLPIHGELVNARRLPMVAELALTPPALAAAEEVEWSRLDKPTLASAVAAWRWLVPSTQRATGESAEMVADLLLAWWQTYESARPRWAVALQALDQMLAEAGI